MKRRVLAVDIGTSSMKGGLIDEGGTLLSRVRIPFEARAPEQGPSEQGPSEQGVPEHRMSEAPGLWHPRRWDDTFSSLVSRIFPHGRFEADAICISGHGPSVVPLGGDGNPSGGALLWHDRRDLRIGGEPSFFLPKIAWYRDHAPGIWEKSRLFLGCPEYLSFRLTGEPLFYTPGNEFNPHIWTEEGARNYDVPRSMLPPLVRTGEPAGRVSSAGAKRFGVPEGIPLAAGGSDFLMALLGSGVVHPGMTCDRAGTSEGINYCSSERVKNSRVRTLPHAVEGLYNVAGILSATGLVFEWLRRLTGQEGRDYRSMLEEIREAAFLPGPLFIPSIHRGAVWEFSGALFAGLQPHHGPVELGVAVVSAIGFGIRDCLEGLVASGCNPGPMRVCGGQGRNRVWNCMKADIAALPLEIPENLDCELTGDAAAALAMLDGSGAGGVAAYADALPVIREIIEPDRENSTRWEERYLHYCGERDRLLGKPGQA